jgi:CheY-like chemotaxis protein
MAAAKGFRVLVVDDYPDAANVLCTLLGLLGHQCRSATRGREAIAVAETFEPEIALVDIGLPDLSGHDVARKLREQAGARPLFLAAISGWGASSDRVQALAAGFDHHVQKPVDATIAKRIVELASNRLTY